MRKVIALVAILFFLGMVAQAQVTPVPIDVTLTATIQAGCYLEITPISVSWMLDVNSESDTWISGDPLLDYTINYRLAEGHTMQLFQESLTDFVYVDGTVIQIENYGRQIFTGDIVVELNLKPQGLLPLLIGQSVDEAGSMVGEIDLQFFNDPTLKSGMVTATIRYTVIDFI